MVRNFFTYLQAPQVVYGRIFGGDTACGDKHFIVHFMRRLACSLFLILKKGKILKSRDRRLFAGLERPSSPGYASGSAIYIELVRRCLFRLIPQDGGLEAIFRRRKRLKEICLIYTLAMRGCRCASHLVPSGLGAMFPSAFLLYRTNLRSSGKNRGVLRRYTQDNGFPKAYCIVTPMYR